MSFSPMLMCKVIAGLLAFVCTVLLTLDLPFSGSLGVSLSHVAQGCRQPADHTKATVHRIFNETIGLDMLSSQDHSNQRSATTKPKWGVLWVQRNETYKQGWGISMFHALHCLEMIRDHLEDKARYQTSDISGRSANNGGHDHEKETHVQHCFAYIAQTITCAGDGTIEPPWEVTDDSGNVMEYGVDGESYQHECRDTRRLWEMSLQSKEHAVEHYDWHMGDTVESLNLQFQG